MSCMIFLRPEMQEGLEPVIKRLFASIACNNYTNNDIEKL